MKVENIHWLGHDSFRIEDQGKQIYIDPWKLSAKAVKADYIFVTHSHYDHFSKEIRNNHSFYYSEYNISYLYVNIYYLSA